MAKVENELCYKFLVANGLISCQLQVYCQPDLAKMKKYPFVAAMVMLLSALQSRAQFAPGPSRHHYKSYSRMSKSEKIAHKRTYFGVTLPVTKLDFSASYYSSDKSISGSTVDQKVYWPKGSPLKPGMNSSLGFIGGTCAKLAKAGKTAMIGLDISIATDVVNFKLDPLPFATSMGDADNFKIVNFRLPLILCYKSGGEVTMKKKDNLFFSIGAGVAPAGLIAGYRDLSAANFALQSVLMSEVGGYFGLGMKLRLSYYPSTCIYFDKDVETTNGTYTERATLGAFTGGTLAISAIILTGTGHWTKDKW